MNYRLSPAEIHRARIREACENRYILAVTLTNWIEIVIVVVILVVAFRFFQKRG